MKNTIKKTANLYVRNYTYGKPELNISFDEHESCDIFAYHKVCDVEIEIPDLSESEMNMMAAGALLESIELAREKLKEECAIKLKAMDDRINELKCIEFKGGEA